MTVVANANRNFFDMGSRMVTVTSVEMTVTLVCVTMIITVFHDSGCGSGLVLWTWCLLHASDKMMEKLIANSQRKHICLSLVLLHHSIGSPFKCIKTRGTI